MKTNSDRLEDGSLLKLIHFMSDGDVYSGEALGRCVGVSRAAVWKKLKHLKSLGLQIESIKGAGYAIKGGLDLLSQPLIQQSLQEKGREGFELCLPVIVDSTNALVLKKMASDMRGAVVCLAEMQEAGRGRRGRVWQSPFAKNIYMSIGWTFEQGIAAIEGLSLAVGVVVAEGLAALGVQGVSLKWPNDLLFEGKKLGGILVEMTGDPSGDCHLVVGLGLNVSMPDVVAKEIDQPWVDISSILGEGKVSRNRIAIELIDRLLVLLEGFEKNKFAFYQERWQGLNFYADKNVVLSSPSHTVSGLCQGVTAQGGLVLRLEDGVEKVFTGGELSLRGC